MAIQLSRSCDLDDFPACTTVADWQQSLATLAWGQWLATQHIRTREQSLCVNWSGAAFTAPGPEALYQYKSGVAGEGKALRQLPALYGLRVIDHAEAPGRFLTRAAHLLRPMGLLFLTFAFWDAEGEDVAEGNGDRVRIYDSQSLRKLVTDARKIGFQAFGGIDWTYHGHKLGDHSLASLVLTRREGSPT